MTAVDRSRQALPLAGRTVAVTHALGQAERLVTLLEAAGACVVLAPVIAIEPPASWAPLDGALARSGDFTWMVFTSANAVASVDQRLKAHGASWTRLRGARVAAVGRATAEVLQECGAQADVVPDAYHGEALLARLRTLIGPRDHVLIPGAAHRSDVLATALRALGASVTEIPAYVVRRADHGLRLLRSVLACGSVDALTFTSSAAVLHVAEAFTDVERRSWNGRIVIASIGPKTAATATAWGLASDVIPREATIPALVGALAWHFGQRSQRTVAARP